MTRRNHFPIGGSLLLILLLGLFAPLATRGEPLQVTLLNSNPNFPNSQVYVMFGGTSSGLDATATVNDVASTKLVEGASYALSQIKDIKLAAFRGCIYVSLGRPLKSASPETAFHPNFNDRSVADYDTRWDKVEITYSPEDPNSGADLSAKDFFSVPLQVNTYTTASPDAAFATLTWRAPTETIFSKLAALSNGSSAALVIGSSGLQTPYGRVVRIISPSKVPDPSVYASFGPYLNFVKSHELTTLVRGLHSPRQSYSLKALVDKAGNLVMTGTVTGVPDPKTQITITRDELLKGIYTGNPSYTVNGTAHTIGMNDPSATAVRDILCGFILGFIGSTEINPNTGDSLGAGPSDRWYQPPIPVKFAFAAAQRENSNFYNQYASYLSTISDASAFPFANLIQKPLASLDPSTIGTLAIAILPDTGASRSLVPAASSQAPKVVPDQKQITSTLEVTNQSNTAYANITLRLKIDHPAIGDLAVKLRSPQGRTFFLHDQSDGATNHLDYIGFALPSPQITNPNGTWTLTISDRKKGNTGTLIDWELSFPTTTDKDRRTTRSPIEKERRSASPAPR